ncbi:unnamed protein product [Protopolystoma xenopodis]|uniref:Uncharacterized protein n=1 Tax=Protopolystoma xenopodis TaxID=117903 RepID=A0A3S5B249_9PLAT|nr:unnamed protein product [Protopolystoma xenopodis]
MNQGVKIFCYLLACMLIFTLATADVTEEPGTDVKETTLGASSEYQSTEPITTTTTGSGGIFGSLISIFGSIFGGPAETKTTPAPTPSTGATASPAA